MVALDFSCLHTGAHKHNSALQCAQGPFAAHNPGQAAVFPLPEVNNVRSASPRLFLLHKAIMEGRNDLPFLQSQHPWRKGPQRRRHYLRPQHCSQLCHGCCLYTGFFGCDNVALCIPLRLRLVCELCCQLNLFEVDSFYFSLSLHSGGRLSEGSNGNGEASAWHYHTVLHIQGGHHCCGRLTCQHGLLHL